MKKIASKLLPLLLVLLLLRVAHAQATDQKPLDLDETAAAHFALGVQAYQAGQWDAARAEFRVCYELSKKPDLLHNLSLVAEKQGNPGEAVGYARRYLNLAQLTEDERSVVLARIQRLQAVSTGAEVAPIPATSPPVQNNTARPGWTTARKAGVASIAVGSGLVLAGIGTAVAGTIARQTLEGMPITADELAAGISAAGKYRAATISLAVVGGSITIAGIVIAAKAKQ